MKHRRFHLLTLFAAMLCCTGCGTAESAGSLSEQTTSAPQISLTTAGTVTTAGETTTASAETTTQSTTSQSTASTTSATTTVSTASSASLASGSGSLTAETTADPNALHGQDFTQSNVIAPGLWLGTKMVVKNDFPERQDTFYEIHADGTGTLRRQTDGAQLEIRYQISNGSMTLTITGLSINSGTVEFDAPDLFTFRSGGIAEEWSYLGDMPLWKKPAYSNNQLIALARAHYAKEDPEGAEFGEADINDAGEIEINLYDTEKKGQLLMTYFIDRYTAKGFDWSALPVDLTK